MKGALPRKSRDEKKGGISPIEKTDFREECLMITTRKSTNKRQEGLGLCPTSRGKRIGDTMSEKEKKGRYLSMKRKKDGEKGSRYILTSGSHERP